VLPSLKNLKPLEAAMIRMVDGDSIKKRLWKSLLGKLAWIAIAFVVFYLIADPLGLIPQSVYDLIAWFEANFNTLVFLLCFMVSAYLANKIIKSRRGAV
jgi:Na+/phosphate symporter